MERYLDGQPLSDIAKANGISRPDVDKYVKRVIRQWKKAAKRDPSNPIASVLNNDR